MAHEEAIKLFKQGIHTDDTDINAYAKKTLPKLEHHLRMAQELARKTTSANRDDAKSSSSYSSLDAH
jgi:predicted outer membrane protein